MNHSQRAYLRPFSGLDVHSLTSLYLFNFQNISKLHNLPKFFDPLLQSSFLIFFWLRPLNYCNETFSFIRIL